ncbi:MAG: hypothetical protein SFV15_23520 [Polyangiaceae bacterium]|nr:hypothetical protein [Polyangiaceae bacterium]
MKFARVVPRASNVQKVEKRCEPLIVEVGAARIRVTASFDVTLLRAVVDALGEGCDT